MNNPILSRALAALLLFAAPPLLSGCGPAAETPPLADAKIGGPFTLTDQDGRKISDGDFAGKYRLIYFGYTFCPDVCPVDVQTLMKGYRKIEASNPALAAKIQPIFITVDPARDTPPVLRQFVRAFHPKLIGLTGSEAEIAAVAKEFAIYYKKQDGTPGTPGYLVDHSRQAMLFDPQGKPLALVAQDKDADAVAADIERWAR
ncbi:protein SCO1/2 [Rhizorhabdus histidinilytica]|uniref:Protein SCO1/2 n=2 Tax=Rhizorhabdus histidinilytica TaxID=439228 RepID=A0A1T5DNV1_9SPHN|nr:protein SCO1/2 [Rhizorhabdus histidinilytica]